MHFLVLWQVHQVLSVKFLALFFDLCLKKGLQNQNKMLQNKYQKSKKKSYEKYTHLTITTSLFGELFFLHFESVWGCKIVLSNIFVLAFDAKRVF